jgi:hypothetical protein
MELGSGVVKTIQNDKSKKGGKGLEWLFCPKRTR